MPPRRPDESGPIGSRLPFPACGVALFSLLAASTAPAQTRSDLAVTLDSQVTAEGGIPWSAKHLPGWPDFRGRPRTGTTIAAQTSSSVTYLLQCRGDRLSFAVLAVFSPSESWVRPDIPTSPNGSVATLRHERTHFNITELFARRLRQAFVQARSICPAGRKEARRAFDRLSQASNAAQDRYDRETAHGMAPDAQARWDREVAAALDSLARYTATARD
jgi:Bacterial protein of unknown function (DUF922)